MRLKNQIKEQIMSYVLIIAVATCLGHIFGRLISDLFLLGVSSMDAKIKGIKKSVDKKMDSLLKADKKQDKKLDKLRK